MRGTSWLVLTKAGIILSDSVNDPVNISAQSGVHPWVALPSTALTPGHYSYLSVGVIQVTPPDHGTTTVSLTSVQDPLIIPGTHHVLRDLTGSVPGVSPALLLSYHRHHHLHQHISRLSSLALLAPAHHRGVLTIVAPVSGGETHWPHIVIVDDLLLQLDQSQIIVEGSLYEVISDEYLINGVHLLKFVFLVSVIISNHQSDVSCAYPEIEDKF